MNVLPFHPDPRLLAMFEGFFLGIAALAIGRAFRGQSTYPESPAEVTAVRGRILAISRAIGR